MAGFLISGTDLDSLFEARGTLTKRADVGFLINATDISNNYASAADGISYGTTGFLTGSTDIGTLFSSKGSIGPQGALWLWGINNYGRLGDNTEVWKSSPVQTIAGGANWQQVSAVEKTAAIKTDGTLWLWGYNKYGQLGNNTIAHKSSPVQTVAGGTNWKQVASGSLYTAAIKTDGTLWLWGYNRSGELGNNVYYTPKSSPVQTIAGGTNWKQVAGGSYRTAAIKTDGTLWLWGDNNYGTLGNNNINVLKTSSPIQTVAGGTNWKQVSAGEQSVAAIKTDGTLWLWGHNSYGTLGNNTIAHKSSPVQTVAGGTNWKEVVGVYHTAAIKTDGTLWLWGYNNYGQLGNNTIAHKSSPVQTVAGGTNWKQVASGSLHTAATKTDGTLWTWGYNAYGQLGDNTTTHKSSPVQTVVGGAIWKQVLGGKLYTAAIRV